MVSYTYMHACIKVLALYFLFAVSSHSGYDVYLYIYYISYFVLYYVFLSLLCVSLSFLYIYTYAIPFTYWHIVYYPTYRYCVRLTWTSYSFIISCALSKHSLVWSVVIQVVTNTSLTILMWSKLFFWIVLKS